MALAFRRLTSYRERVEDCTICGTPLTESLFHLLGDQLILTHERLIWFAPTGWVCTRERSMWRDFTDYLDCRRPRFVHTDATRLGVQSLLSWRIIKLSIVQSIHIQNASGKIWSKKIRRSKAPVAWSFRCVLRCRQHRDLCGRHR